MRDEEYRTINVWVGKKEGFSERNQKTSHGDDVEFEGIELAVHVMAGEVADEVTQTLYETEDRRLIVHLKEESRYHLFTTVCTLCEVTEDDLRLDGKFALLGAKCERFRRPLTLDEALERYGDTS